MPLAAVVAVAAMAAVAAVVGAAHAARGQREINLVVQPAVGPVDLRRVAEER